MPWHRLVSYFLRSPFLAKLRSPEASFLLAPPPSPLPRPVAPEFGRPLTLPYAHLNLRWNPFGQVPLAERGALAVVAVDHLAARLRQPGFAVQFLGACGRGKSTHLHALHDHFPQAPYYYFAEGAPIPTIAAAPVLFLDETQRLPRSLRSRLFRWPASFVLSTHEDHRRELERAGVSCETVRLHGLTAERLQAIVDRRLAWARRGPGPVPRLTPAAMRALLERFGDDVRSIESYLYEVYQTLTEVRDVEL